jgi:hypothetical protein
VSFGVRIETQGLFLEESINYKFIGDGKFIYTNIIIQWNRPALAGPTQKLFQQ